MFATLLSFTKFIVRNSIASIARFLPIKENFIVFASFPDFSDNAWVLFEYLKENRPDLKLYWAISETEIPEDVNKSSVIKKDSLKNYLRYYWIINRARFLLSSHGLRDSAGRKGQLNIYLNHCSCPIKGAKTKGINHPSKDYKIKPTFDYVLCRGLSAITPLALFNCCDEKYVLPLGMARDDVFLQNIGEGSLNPFYNGVSNKLIVWMPTFRRTSITPCLSETNSSTATGLPLIETELDMVKLNSFLQKHNIQLLIKIHPLQEDNDLFKKKFSNITIVTNQDLKRIHKQTYEVIGYSDALLTDYSSVYFDYLMTNKQVGFILDDYDKYDKDRGFVFENPKEILAGKHIYNSEDLFNFFIDVIEDNDEYENMRKMMREKFVGDMPKSTCKVIVDYFNI